MTTPTAADFAAARFAEHPDGRIAARVDHESSHPWAARAGDKWGWMTDEVLAAQGWRIVTPALDPSDPDVIEQAARRARDAYLGDREALPEFTWDVYRDIARAALALPPARPEGLARLIDTIRESTYASEPEALGEALYNAGVRVGGGEG